ncbi:MAG: Crp/Fnr family transcriptional regulator [Candidatus Alcyoniella australis]|nr:Crp/Fnr family transcriptional regulator [Candidatus Alcyoniella australis]
MRKSLEAMREVPLFKGLGDRELGLLYERCVVRSYEPDTIIVRQGAVGDALYVVLSGKVKVTLYSESGREVVLDTLAPESFFGEMSLIDAAPRSANVITVEQSELLYLGRRDFRRALTDNPTLALSLLEELCRRLREADAKIGHLALVDVQGRVAGFLLRLGREHGKKMAGGYLIEKRPTHLEMAGLLGTSRETVSRAMSEFIKRGYIRQQGRKLFIPLDTLLDPKDGGGL